MLDDTLNWMAAAYSLSPTFPIRAFHCRLAASRQIVCTDSGNFKPSPWRAANERKTNQRGNSFAGWRDYGVIACSDVAIP